MNTAAARPRDFRLVLHASLSDGYERSQVLLAKADFDGTLQLLTSAWERALGYGREEFRGKTLDHLMWCNHRSAALAVAAILDERSTGPIDIRVRCRDGLGKGLRLHRHFDQRDRTMYIVAEEIPAKPARIAANFRERRAAVR